MPKDQAILLCRIGQKGKTQSGGFIVAICSKRWHKFRSFHSDELVRKVSQEQAILLIRAGQKGGIRAGIIDVKRCLEMW